MKQKKGDSVTEGIYSTVNSHDDWYSSPVGSYVQLRTEQLITTLMPLDGRERLLDAGCKTGRNLLLFRRLGCTVTGLEPSPEFADKARNRLGSVAEVHRSDLEDFPFSDDEFDLVTVILSLESTRNPHNTLREAVRVCRGRIFIGLVNRLSFSAHRLKTPLFSTAPLHSFSIFDIMRMVRTILPDVPLDWGSVVCFPVGWHPLAEGPDRRFPLRRNPFGAIAGLTFPVSYHCRTIQEPLRVDVKTPLRETRRVPGTACNRRR